MSRPGLESDRTGSRSPDQRCQILNSCKHSSEQIHSHCHCNEGQSGLAKGDITRPIMSYAKEILLICFIVFARWQQASQIWSSGCIWDPILGEGRSATVSLERAMVVSYRLSIVTIALSLTIRPQCAIECLRLSTGGGGHFEVKFGEEG